MMKQIENPYVQYMYSYPHKTAYGSLEDVYLNDYLDELIGKENSLYFHIPFCQYKCGYCNLFSAAGQSEKWMQDYVEAMERQAEQLAKIMPEGVKFSDLTLGGGTPLILPEELLRKIFFMARHYFGFETDGHSVVVETSPNQTTKEKLLLLKQEGVSRVSIGVQSFIKEELVALHRFHDVDTARQALEAIREMNFDCMNVDLIYGIPGQTMDSLLYSLRQALEYEPEEIFIYPLYVKPGTYLYQQGAVRNQETFQMYHMVREVLCEAGYQPHSMRRFVKEKKNLDGVNVRDINCLKIDGNLKNQNLEIEKNIKNYGKFKNENVQSLEIANKKYEELKNENNQSLEVGNLKYLEGYGAVENNLVNPQKKVVDNLPESLCGFGNTISIGCGGRSYIGNLHFCTPYAVKQKDCIASIKEYIGRSDYLQVPHGFLLSREEQKRRYVIKHILFGKGINCKDYREHFQDEVTEAFPQIKEWEQDGYVAIEKDYITLTEEGFALSDYLGPQFISQEVRKKTEEYYKRL